MNATQALAHALEDLVKTRKQFTNYDVTKHARSFTDDNVRHQDAISHVSVEMDSNTDYYVDTVSVSSKRDQSLSVSAVLYSPHSRYASEYSSNDIQTDKSLKGKSSCCGGNPCFSDAVKSALDAASVASATVKKFQSGYTKTLPSSVGVFAGRAISTIGGAFGAGKTLVGVDMAGSARQGKQITRQVIIDNRGRVCIPKSFLDRIGKTGGDVVYVQKSSIKGKLIITAIRWSDASCSYLTTNQVDCYGNVRITPKSMKQCVVKKTAKGSDSYVTVRSESDHIVIEA